MSVTKTTRRGFLSLLAAAVPAVAALGAAKTAQAVEPAPNISAYGAWAKAADLLTVNTTYVGQPFYTFSAGGDTGLFRYSADPDVVHLAVDGADMGSVSRGNVGLTPYALTTGHVITNRVTFNPALAPAPVTVSSLDFRGATGLTFRGSDAGIWATDRDGTIRFSQARDA